MVMVLLVAKGIAGLVLLGLCYGLMVNLMAEIYTKKLCGGEVEDNNKPLNFDWGEVE